MAGLLTREGGDDRQLDLLLVVDAGLRSAVAAGRLDRLGVHVTAALALTAAATQRGDRVGLLLHAGTTLAAFAPVPGPLATLRIGRALAGVASGRHGWPACRHRPPGTRAAAARGASWSGSPRSTRHCRPMISRLWCGNWRPGIGSCSLVSTCSRLRRCGCSRRSPRRSTTRGSRWVAAEQARSTAQTQRRLRALGAPVVVASPAAIEDALLREYARQRAGR